MAESQGSQVDSDDGRGGVGGTGALSRRQIPIRPTAPDPWDSAPRWRAALFVALSALVVQTVIVHLWTGGALFQIYGFPGVLGVLGIVAGIALFAGGLAALLLPWLRGFVGLLQCLVFGGLGAAMQFLIVIGLMLFGEFSKMGSGGAPFAGFGGELLMILLLWVFTILPGFITGFVAWALARLAARGRTGIVVLLALGAAAVLVWIAVAVFGSLPGPVEPVPTPGGCQPGSTVCPAPEPRPELEPQPGLPDGCGTDGAGLSLPPPGCPDPRGAGAPT